MLTNIHIQGYKAFADLQIPDLKRVNLIAGRSNTGKTALLEAIYLLLGGAKAITAVSELFRNTGTIKEQSEDYWRWMFHKGRRDDFSIAAMDVSMSGAMETLACHATYSRQSLASKNVSGILVAGSPHVAVFWGWRDSRTLNSDEAAPATKPRVLAISTRWRELSDDAVQHDRVVLKSDGEEKIEAFMRKIDPRIKTIRSLKPYGTSLVYVDLGLGERIPLVHLGQGVSRALSIYSALIASGATYLLIDEIENGQHHESMIELWRGIQALSEQEGVQIFATTHSYECIRAAHEVFSQSTDYDLALHRLDLVDGEIKAATLGQDAIATVIEQGLEVR